MDSVKTREIYEKFQTILNPYGMPKHVFNRIASLLGLNSPTYLDGKIFKDESDTLYGIAVAFTPHIAIEANWLNERAFEPARRDASTATVTAWARSTLRGVSIRQGDLRQNYDADWAQYNENHWPSQCSMDLTYEARKEVLTLPINPYPGESRLIELHQLIPDIMRDLNHE